jgi:hypothetical protein
VVAPSNTEGGRGHDRAHPEDRIRATWKGHPAGIREGDTAPSRLTSVRPASAQFEERDLILRGELSDVLDMFAKEIDDVLSGAIAEA